MANQFDGIDGTKCPHHEDDVRMKKGSTGKWCRRCGLKIYEEEKRKCGECRQYKVLMPVAPGANFGRAICMKKQVTVRYDSHAMYKIRDRTCFEEKPQFLKKTRLKGEIRVLKGLNRVLGKMNEKK